MNQQEEKLAELSRIVHETIRTENDNLVALAQDLWDNPELTGKEFESSKKIQKFLTDRGFTVNPGKSGLPAAFVAEYGNGPFVVDISVEMDALPIADEGRSINHACGHNVMASMSIAAGLALKAIADKAGIKIRLQGDPGEEGLGQKIIKLEAGDYDGAHIYMGPHSAGIDRTELPSLANQPYEVRMTGKSSHDASGRQFGLPVKPAMDAFVRALDNLQLYGPPGTIINHQGGPYIPGQANIISDVAVLPIMVRHPDTETLHKVIMPRIFEAAEGAGKMYRVGVVGRPLGPSYAATNTQKNLSDLFVDAAKQEGREIQVTEPSVLPSSTDFWNIPIPKVHPLIDIRDPDKKTDETLPLHSVPMIRAANPKNNPKGISNAIMQAGAAFAMVAARIASNPELLQEFTKSNFKAADMLTSGRPPEFSAPAGWDTPKSFSDGPNQELHTKALEPKSLEFALPSVSNAPSSSAPAASSSSDG